MIFVVLLVVSLSASGSYGSIIGNCKTVKSMAEFDLEKIVGSWYEIESLPSLEKIKTKCNEHVINSKGNGKAGLLFKYKTPVSKKEKSIYYEISTRKMSEPGKLTIKHVKGGSFSIVAPKSYTLNVIDTDYENYILFYGCEKPSFISPKSEKMMIMSRKREMDDATKVKVYDILENNGIDQKNILEISHEDCDKKEGE